jgi:hypothetical protein
VTTPSRGRRGADTAKRSIHFFRIDGGAADSGVLIDVDLHPALQKLGGLPFRNADNGGRYIPDPSTSQTNTVPVGACSQVGYIGSAWCSLVTPRLAVCPEVSEHSASAKVWIPALDLPPWQREQRT